MKKIIFLAIAWMTFSGFAIKNNQSNKVAETASIAYLGDPRADGFGWVIMLDETNFVVPLNLDEEFMQEGIPVNVDFERTGETFPCRCTDPVYMVDILSISHAKGR